MSRMCATNKFKDRRRGASLPGWARNGMSSDTGIMKVLTLTCKRAMGILHGATIQALIRWSTPEKSYRYRQGLNPRPRAYYAEPNDLITGAMIIKYKKNYFLLKSAAKRGNSASIKIISF